ncbi:Flp pilus assembly protein CpaB [Gilvimarinus sp. SDUM040013]|uniref:Flp pilus assembly protein CpaB n=1 Tax=Gilvimarinus gilvus TaxID=3058038 RepID=A0ABU4RYJ6_9GAMM|nr:Flp pilus assembly protein CpaB [Gilvimarinus sp. SDUM040013]MDO3386266.1 Flp pilus assembly protein CpaB [Gilvimarinus sp. SDUM040013]MDX6849739.1 Flp pilus assembly protein CpaB [Gilvimarinus sp. SDUM040013]
MKQMSGSRLFMIAVVCGVVAAFLIVYYLKSVEERYRRANQPERIEKISVVVPKRDLNKGDTITIDAIGKLTVPKKFLPTNYVPASDYKKVLNRTIASPMRAGRVMTVEAITGTKAETFSETLDLGKRAYSIKVNKVDSFDGLLRPGDTIDLMGEFDLEDLGIEGGSDQDVSEVVMPVLEKVVVLSAGREDHTGRRYERSRQGNSADGFNMEFTIVTLSLSPRQVARVQLAEQAGEMFAVLRHPKDTSMAEFDYIRADVLLEPEPAPTVDVVLDENGNPIGRIVGDNVVDANGNIIGKVVDGKAVGFDGKPLGTIVENVSEDDPMLRVRERADVVRDANGNVIGKVVDGQIIDRNGNVIGRVDENGQAVGLNGEVIGTVQKNVALDAQGNVVDLRDSAVPQGRSEVAQIVRDKDGNVIGRVVDGKIVDKNGKVIGRVDESGNAVGLSGESLGTVEEAVVDRDGNVVGQVKEVVRDSSGRVVGEVQEVVRDADGNVIGRVVNGQVVDENGNVVGAVNADGTVTGLDGKKLGTVEKVVVDKDGNVIGTVDKNGRAIGANGEVLGSAEKVMVDENGEVMGSVEDVVRDSSGNIVGKVEEVVRDKDGNIIGRVVNGQVVDEDGNVIGTVNDDGSVTGLDGETLGTVDKVVVDDQGNIVGRVREDGTAVGADGRVLGQVEQAILGPDGQELDEQTQVVRDKDGNVIGRIVDGQVVDNKGNVVGRVVNGQVVDANGNVIADGVTVTTESRRQVAAEMRADNAAKITREVDYIEFISGGSDEEGIIPVRRVRLQ